jgi:hypothetical protein
MPRPSYDEILHDLQGLTPPQQREYMSEVERRWPVGAPEEPNLKAGDQFVRGVASTLNPVTMAKGAYGAIRHPEDNIVQPMRDQWEKGGAAAIEGRWPEAVAHGVAGTVPILGPAAANVGERMGTGENTPEVLGEATGMVLSAGLPSAIARAPGLAVGAANKVRAPFAGHVDAGVQAALARVNGAGGAAVEMPAGALSTSGVVPVLEAVSMKGLGGGATKARYMNAATELTARAEHLVARASRYATESERGLALAKGFKSYRDAWIRTKNGLYNSAAIPEGLQLTPAATVGLLDEVLKGKEGAARIAGGATDLSYFQRLREGLSKGTVSAKDFRSAIQDLNGKIGGAFADPWSAANKQLLKKLAATMDDDFKAALPADVAGKLARANTVYAEGLAKINSTFGKSISKLAKAGKYDDIARSVANAGMSVDDIPRIMQVVGAEGADAMRASVMAEIVGRATKNGRLTPQGLRMALEGYEKSAPGALDALLKPGQASMLRDISTLSQSLERGVKVAEGSQTMFGARVMGQLGTLVANPALGLKLLIGDIAFNKFVSSKVGQKWLTEGFKPWTAPNLSVDRPGAAVGSVAASGAGIPAMQPAPATR